jgi:hypothetical protein
MIEMNQIPRLLSRLGKSERSKLLTSSPAKGSTSKRHHLASATAGYQSLIPRGMTENVGQDETALEAHSKTPPAAFCQHL